MEGQANVAVGLGMDLPGVNPHPGPDAGSFGPGAGGQGGLGPGCRSECPRRGGKGEKQAVSLSVHHPSVLV